MQYLQPPQRYSDLYDLCTIERCLDWYWSIKNKFETKRKSQEFKKFSKKKFDEEVHKVASYTVNVIKIERYRRRGETIEEWMNRDKAAQEKYDNAVAPRDIYCKDCFCRTEMVSKDLLNSYEDDSRVLFMFECVKCKKRQVLYEDGSEWYYDPPRCPKCEGVLNHDSKYAKEIMTTIDSCPNCQYKNKDVYDFKKSGKERKEKEAKDRKLLVEYRKEFCFDDVEGPKAVLNLDGIARLVKEWKEEETKSKNPIYQKARQLKTPKIGQLKELLETTIQKGGYQDLKFDKPEMGQFVIIGFSVNDMKNERTEHDSKKALKALIVGVLEGTTWRLMNEGVDYRLGILTGRLKAHEQEEDLIMLVTS